MMTDVEDRFWPKVRIGDGCWEWTASKDRKGYGKFGHGRLAHRVSWAADYGVHRHTVRDVVTGRTWRHVS